MQWFARLAGKLFRRDSLFKQTPCLAPWYFSPSNPHLVRNDADMRWNYVEKVHDAHVGVMALLDQNDVCYGFAGIYTCIFAHPQSEKFLVWNYKYCHGDSPGMLLSLYETSALRPIENPENAAFALQVNKETSHCFNAVPADFFVLTLDPSLTEQEIVFPEPFKCFPDFCIVTNIPGLYPHDNSQTKDTAIILLSPETDKLYLYPQDWFNQSEAIDFGYQWITRAVKNPQTGLIHAQGIRLRDFVLDKTGRQRK
ncbi:TPA: hypothetical protein DDW35_09950 [Candidatus Sumerlaeota bacterium]|jgi:hypothetical protein|nr:hypothetical protein [Candidatus Sumerlaeota bacterium]